MIATTTRPRFQLFVECSAAADEPTWRFALRGARGETLLEAEDTDPQASALRLELLAVVRGLEALEEPATVLLHVVSDEVARGIRDNIRHWRRTNFRWESFGQLVPVKNRDLWLRIDRALRFHQVQCRVWRIDQPHGSRTPQPEQSAEPVARERNEAAPPLAPVAPEAPPNPLGPFAPQPAYNSGPDEALAACVANPPAEARPRIATRPTRPVRRRWLKILESVRQRADQFRLALEPDGAGLLPRPSAG